MLRYKWREDSRLAIIRVTLGGWSKAAWQGSKLEEWVLGQAGLQCTPLNQIGETIHSVQKVERVRFLVFSFLPKVVLG